MATFTVLVKQGLAQAAVGCIQAYRYFLSPWLGFQCRFYPTCSLYAKEAFQKHGWWTGAYLALLRVLRCHPWHPGGTDAVPLKINEKK